MTNDDAEIDLHRLDLRYATTRVVEPRAVTRLTRSIEQCGQIVPCTAVTVPDGPGLVLVDGFRRVEALRRLGRDTARVSVWTCALSQALVGVLTRSDGRAFGAIEEALQLRDLVQSLGLSQQDAARQCGRHPSWVSRRLALLSGLSDAALAAVRSGRLSSWAASRIVAPLARANADHADRLLTAQALDQLSTRELKLWFEHYRRSSRGVRERLVDHPRLLIDTLRERAATDAAAQLGAGPEGACAKDLRVITAVIKRLTDRLGDLDPVPTPIRCAVPRLKTAFTTLI